ncbi:MULTISPECIES: FecR family protein [unclassified Desulfurobacterium]|uniref:FecR family protein n=1 Tax=Desulfurobacterium sp. TC5-1 TaxID=1158318 RepID=UPI0003B360A4|nr:FecR family protein [Desulfurobacterium sp. TC5-1]
MKKYLIVMFLFAIPLSAHGYVGKIVKATGRVEVVRKDTFKGIFWKKIRGIFDVGDVVRTKRRSKATINFIDKSSVTMLESSRLIVERYIPSGTVAVENPYGKVVYKIVKRTRGKFIIKTPVAIIGVKGTELFVDSSINRVTVIVNSGLVEVKNLFYPQKLIEVKKGEMITIYPVRKLFYPKIAPEEVLKKIFYERESAEKTEYPSLTPYNGKEEEIMEEMDVEKPEKSRANFNIEIPDTSIEGL